jgi:hypothetical protein
MGAIRVSSLPAANRGFCISRGLVLVVLLVSAAVVGSLTYIFVGGDEDEDYQHRQVSEVREVSCD